LAALSGLLVRLLGLLTGLLLAALLAALSGLLARLLGLLSGLIWIILCHLFAFLETYSRPSTVRGPVAASV
jgi:hypothetical protein